jgi:hypothetical protein
MPLPVRHVAAALAATALATAGFAAAQSADEPITMAREVVAAAVAFQDYVARASTTSTAFKDAKGVRAATVAGASYEVGQFQQGMIAYGAMAAAQDDRFVDGINRAAQGPAERHALAAQLMANPDTVMQIEGALGAGRRVQAALQHPGEQLIAQGKKLERASYEVQRQSWSKVHSSTTARLAEVKMLSATRAAFRDGDEARLIKDLIERPRAEGSGAVTPVVSRALALAAVAVLGEARTQDMPRMNAIFTDIGSAACLKMSKMMLNQCTAVASPQYESIYCLGVHAVGDTGQCIVKAAAGRTPGPIYPTVMAAGGAATWQTASAAGAYQSASPLAPASISDLLDRPTSRVRALRAD